MKKNSLCSQALAATSTITQYTMLLPTYKIQKKNATPYVQISFDRTHPAEGIHCTGRPGIGICFGIQLM